MFTIPGAFDFRFLVGQTFHTMHVQKNMLELELGLDASLKDGVYGEYSRIEVEHALIFEKHGRIESFGRLESAKPLSAAACPLASLIAETIQHIDRQSDTELRLVFSSGATVTLLADKLESYHFRSNRGSFSV